MFNTLCLDDTPTTRNEVHKRCVVFISHQMAVTQCRFYCLGASYRAGVLGAWSTYIRDVIPLSVNPPDKPLYLHFYSQLFEEKRTVNYVNSLKMSSWNVQNTYHDLFCFVFFALLIQTNMILFPVQFCQGVLKHLSQSVSISGVYLK